MTPMRARRDESIWSTDAAAGYCRAVNEFAETRSSAAPSACLPKADAVVSRPQRARTRTQRVGPYLCVVLGTALGYLCGYLWRVL
jgi:hypothetical protein